MWGVAAGRQVRGGRLSAAGGRSHLECQVVNGGGKFGTVDIHGRVVYIHVCPCASGYTRHWPNYNLERFIFSTPLPPIQKQPPPDLKAWSYKNGELQHHPRRRTMSTLMAQTLSFVLLVWWIVWELMRHPVPAEASIPAAAVPLGGGVHLGVQETYQTCADW